MRAPAPSRPSRSVGSPFSNWSSNLQVNGVASRTTAPGGSLWRQDPLGNALPVARRDWERTLPDAGWRRGVGAGRRADATATTSMAGTPPSDRLSEVAEAFHTRREGTDEETARALRSRIYLLKGPGFGAGPTPRLRGAQATWRMWPRMPVARRKAKPRHHLAHYAGIFQADPMADTTSCTSHGVHLAAFLDAFT
jgi:hypothetical protein